MNIWERSRLPNKFSAQNTQNNNTPNLPPDGRVDTQSLKISSRGVDLIKRFEGFRLKAYNDNKGFCTIGCGLLLAKQTCESIKASPGFKNPDYQINGVTRDEILHGMTENRVGYFFNKKIIEAERVVKRNVLVKLHQNEFDALVSLAYNLGSLGKAPKLLRYLNSASSKLTSAERERAYYMASEEFRDITDGGDEGLYNRRLAEIGVFRKGLYPNGIHKPK